MENPSKATFHTENPHSQHFTKFENTRLMDRLQKKFTPKPYWKNYALLRGVVLVSSYLFNVLSAATAAALVFFSLRALVGNDVLAGTITAAALVALELVKRETGTRFFSDFLQFRKMSAGLAAVVLMMMGLSTTASYFGAKRAVVEFTKPPATIRGDSITAPLLAQISAADEQIKAAGKMTVEGVVTRTAQRTIERLSRQKETALNEIARQQKRADDHNDTATTAHELATKINANGFAAVTLCSELLLLLCLFYLQFYDYRSFVEHCDGYTTLKADIHQPLQTQNAPAAITQSANGATFTRPRADVKRSFQISDDPPLTDGQRRCEHCATVYTYGHARQRFCGEKCRVLSWQERTGKQIRHRINAT